MKVKPLHDRLIVKRTEEEEKTKGGLSFPIPQRKSRSRVK